MMYAAVKFVCDELSGHLSRQYQTPPDAAILAGIHGADGTLSPKITDNIEKIDIELENMNFHEMSNIWGMMGGRHFPCLLYRLRLVTVDSEVLVRELPEVRRPTVGAGS